TRAQADGGPTDALPVTNVADGLRLHALAEEGAIPFGTPPLPAADSPDGQMIAQALAGLADALDALADTALAEGVLQPVTGNAGRAGATLAALPRGDAPPPQLAF